MALQFNNWQPVQFNETSVICSTSQSEYCLRKAPSDKVQFQFKNSPDNSNKISTDCDFQLGQNLIINPDCLNPPGDGWVLDEYSYTGSGLQSNIIVSGTQTIEQVIPDMVQGKFYFVKMIVNCFARSGGSEFKIIVGGQDSDDPISAATLSTDTYIQGYFQAGSVDDKFIVKNNSNIRIVIKDVQVFEVCAIESGFTLNQFNWISESGYEDTSWEYNDEDGGVCRIGGAADFTIPLSTPVIAGQAYQMQVEVRNVTTGTLNINGAGQVNSVSANGIFTFNWVAPISPLFAGFVIFSTSDGWDGCILSVNVWSLSEGIEVVLWSNGQFIDYLNSEEINQLGDTTYVEFTPADYGLNDGDCFNIRLGVPCVDTETIPVFDEWEIEQESGSYSIDGNALIANVDGAVLNAIICFNFPECFVNQEVVLKFKYKSPDNTAIDFLFDNTFVPEVYDEQGFKGETNEWVEYSVTFTPTSSELGCLNFTLSNNEEETLQMGLKDFEFIAPSACCESAETYESNCICICDDDCTKEFIWTQTKNGFGFNYADSQVRPTFTMRLLSEFGKWKYPQTSDLFENDLLQPKWVNVNSKELFEVKVESLPYYLLRCLAIARQHQTFKIDGVQVYAEPSDLEPEWTDKQKTKAMVRFNVWKDSRMSNACGRDNT
jgi:hypothetical protein